MGMRLVKKIWGYRKALRSIFSTIYFNFKYLPANQAVKLPILLYKPKFIKLKGSFSIASLDVKFGMIKLGFPDVSIYPNTGIIIENHGGKCVFWGSCRIGNASAISIGDQGYVSFGDDFKATANLKLVCYHYIQFKDRVRVGWDNVIMDTDLHTMVKLSGGYTKGFGPVLIGNDNWLGLRCTVLKNTTTPNFCTVGSNSVLNRKYDYEPYVMIAGNPCTKKIDGIYHDVKDDIITYQLFDSNS